MNRVPLTKFSKDNLADMIVKEQAENARLKELSREMVAVLQSVEWACTVRWRNEIDHCCPACGELIYKGHSNRCNLATVLAKAKEEEE